MSMSKYFKNVTELYKNGNYLLSRDSLDLVEKLQKNSS